MQQANLEVTPCFQYFCSGIVTSRRLRPAVSKQLGRQSRCANLPWLVKFRGTFQPRAPTPAAAALINLRFCFEIPDRSVATQAMFQMSIFCQNYLLLAGTWTSISHSLVVTRSDNLVPLNAITKVSTEPLRLQGHARGIHKASPGWRLQRKGRATVQERAPPLGVGWPWRNWRLCYFKRNDAYQIGAREHRVSNMKPLLGHVSCMLIVRVELIVSSSGGS